jgi:outer membrane protein TolC
MQNNPALQGAGLDVERAKHGVVAEEGRYPFIFQADAGYTRTETPRLLGGDRTASMPTRSYQAGTALRRTFASGGTAEARVEGERFETDRATSPNLTNGQFVQANGYSAAGRLSMSQPLLRGAGTDVGELGLRQARANRVVAEKARRRVASQLARDVLIAYWEAWYAGEALRIERSALELAVAQERDAMGRVSQGSLASADALSFATRVAELEESIARSEAALDARLIELRRLMASSREGAPLAVANAPPELLRTPTRAELEAGLGSDSIELAELEAQVQEKRVAAEVAGDAQRPRLDVEGYIESRGVGDELGGAFERASQAKWLTAHVGITFEAPLDDSRRRAEKTQALLAASSAEAALRDARERVAAGAALGAANEAAARRSLELSHKTLEITRQSQKAEEERYRLGLSIPVSVQQAGDDVRRAELREARAKVDLIEEQARLLHYAGKLLEQYGL